MAPLARVLPDTSVCFPISVLDLILRCDEADLRRVIWTEELLNELERVWVAKGARSATSARKVCAEIRATFPDQEVPRSRYAELIDSMPGADVDDHVHAAAAVAEAPAVLLTANLKDFPAPKLADHGVRVEQPDGYFTSLLEQHPDDLRQVITEMAEARRRPPMTRADIIDALERAGLVTFAGSVRDELR